MRSIKNRPAIDALDMPALVHVVTIQIMTSHNVAEEKYQFKDEYRIG
jgi:hypothetical protein